MVDRQGALSHISFDWHDYPPSLSSVFLQNGPPLFFFALNTFTITYSMSNLVSSLGCRITLPGLDIWLWDFLAMQRGASCLLLSLCSSVKWGGNSKPPRGQLKDYMKHLASVMHIVNAQ